MFVYHLNFGFDETNYGRDISRCAVQCEAVVVHKVIAKRSNASACFRPVCADNNHVRTWTVTRFRGMISTQPGSMPLASFKVLALEPPQASGKFPSIRRFNAWPVMRDQRECLSPHSQLRCGEQHRTIRRSRGDPGVRAEGASPLRHPLHQAVIEWPEVCCCTVCCLDTWGVLLLSVLRGHMRCVTSQCVAWNLRCVAWTPVLECRLWHSQVFKSTSSGTLFIGFRW